jgi:hypothetical protein
MPETAQPPIEPRANWRWLVWLFAALGVAAAIALIWLVVMVNGSFRPREFAKVDAAAPPGKIYAVGDVSELQGTGKIAVQINLVNENSGSGYSKIKSGDYGDQRNLVLIDRESGESNQLLPNNDREIVGSQYFAAQAGSGQAGGREYDDNASKAPLVYFALVLTDPNIENGKRDIVVGTLATRNQAVVQTGLDGVDDMRMLDNRRLALIVREKQTLYYRIIDLSELKLLQSSKIKIG